MSSSAEVYGGWIDVHYTLGPATTAPGACSVEWRGGLDWSLDSLEAHGGSRASCITAIQAGLRRFTLDLDHDSHGG